MLQLVKLLFEKINQFYILFIEIYIRVIIEIFKREIHTFSHFKLLYTPIIIEVSVKEQIENNSQDSVWYTSNNKLKLGVPAPVKLLLNTAGKMLYFNEVQNG